MFTGYERLLATAPGASPGALLNADTVRVYLSRVRQYLAWLATHADGEAPEGDPLSDPHARDRAVRDYRTHLQTVLKRKPTTINAHLTAIDDFYRRRGLGPAAAERTDLPQAPAAPRALSEDDQRRLLREAERVPLRDAAIVHTAFYTGTRISEITALDAGDVDLAVGEGHLIVGRATNGRQRQIPLHPRLRDVLERWLEERTGWTATSPALFLNRRGGRLSTRSAYTVLRTVADAAGLPLGGDGVFTPRVLRDTAGTTMARTGTDIVIVAELLGHSVETARRYSVPGHRDRRQAIERLTERP